MNKNTIQFIGHGKMWFDKINGNTYHSVRITDTKTKKTLFCEWQYGYDDQYKYTSLKAMLKNKWLPKKYNDDNCQSYERENNYPIKWISEENCLKKDLINHGKGA